MLMEVFQSLQEVMFILDGARRTINHISKISKTYGTDIFFSSDRGIIKID